ncbi:MAG: hypothetical protein HY372_02215 [Candidatus Andersenbacteria bacterium]|nr:hypothetical protein [Candidatus Andersenbacteria bacterium]
MPLSSYLTILLLVGLIWVVWVQLEDVEERTLIHIMASQEAELGLPIYAQFTATQTLMVVEPAVLTRLVVPAHFPSSDLGLKIDLIAGEELLWRWRVQPPGVGTVQLDLTLPGRRVEPGELQVQFSAADVGHEQAARAARLFVEPDDSQYPDGHYRIAANEKQGDISLKLVEQRPRWEWVRTRAQQRPLKVVAQAGGYALLGALVLAVPGVAMNALRPLRGGPW